MPAPGKPTFGQGHAAAKVLRHVIAAAAAAGGRLSPDTSARLARIGGTIEWAARRRKRRVLSENLARALGPSATASRLRAVVREEIVNEGRRSGDFLWGVAHPELAARSMRIDGMHHLRDALAHGHGAVLASPHIGGWEVIVPLAALVHDISVTVMVEDDWLAWAVADIRTRGGLDVVSISEPPLRALNALRDGQVVVVLADVAQPGMRTAEVTMLGAPLLLPAGPAALSRIARAPLLPFAVLPIDTRAWRLWIGEPIGPPPRASGRAGEIAATQALADVWSEIIRAHPTHWAAVYPMPWRDGTSR
jgi:lauroyl/myristoyl acyltransferase